MSAALEFTEARQEGLRILLALIGGTGSGKTRSAMEIAKGLAGGRKFAVIDTENGRAKHYAKHFKFDHAVMRPPFRPFAYADAVRQADEAGYPVIVVDSGSHGWAGEGGVLDWREEILEAMVERKRKFYEKMQWQNFDEWAVRESLNWASWIDPKMDWKAMVQRLLQCRAHVIMCFRAEEKIEIVKVDADGNVVDENDPNANKRGRAKPKTVVRPKQSAIGRDGWMAICEKNFVYEATASVLFTADRPGYPLPIKMPDELLHVFPEDKRITPETGAGMSRWAEGEDERTREHHKPAPRDDRIPSIAEVRAIIERAKVPEDLAAVGPMARKLTSKEREEIQTLFNLKRTELYAKPTPKYDPSEFDYGPPPMKDDGPVTEEDVRAAEANIARQRNLDLADDDERAPAGT